MHVAQLQSTPSHSAEVNGALCHCSMQQHWTGVLLVNQHQCFISEGKRNRGVWESSLLSVLLYPPPLSSHPLKLPSITISRRFSSNLRVQTMRTHVLWLAPQDGLVFHTGISPSLLADLKTSGLFEQQIYWLENCPCCLMSTRM